MQNSDPVVADMDFIAEAIRHLGYPAEVVALASGGKGVHSKANGIPFTAFMFRNDHGTSPYLMLSALFPGHPVSLEATNAWNTRFPLTRASLSRDGDAMLTHAVLLTGIDTSHLKETMIWWDLLMRVYAREVLAGTA
ncbi:MAG: YbjN domain-containing protein [Hyphomicrobiaceae bacterium]|nr:YbjN domain-containing protein [Hyphomicrobiaceae bacterium]